MNMNEDERINIRISEYSSYCISNRQTDRQNQSLSIHYLSLIHKVEIEVESNRIGIGLTDIG